MKPIAILTAALLFAAPVMAAETAATPTPATPPVATVETPKGMPKVNKEEKIKAAQARADERFQKADVNKDGKLSKEEMLKVSQERAEARFVKIDSNKDGFVTKEEMMAMRKEKWADHMKNRGPMGEGPEGKMPMMNDKPAPVPSEAPKAE